MFVLLSKSPPRNHWLLGILLLMACMAHGQPGNPTVRNYVIVSEVPSAQAIPQGKSVIPPDSAYFLGWDSLKVEGNLDWNAACKDGKKEAMSHLAKARFRGDTLVVSIFRNDRLYVYELEIKVWRQEFICSYRIIPRTGMSAIFVVPTDQVLVLEKLRFDRGDTVTGFVNFRGTKGRNVRPDMPWDTRKDWVESDFVLRGPFKARIQ